MYEPMIPLPKTTVRSKRRKAYARLTVNLSYNNEAFLWLVYRYRLSTAQKNNYIFSFLKKIIPRHLLLNIKYIQ